MNKLTTQCPHCKTDFEIERSWIGQQTSCPVCRKDFTIQTKKIPLPPPPPPVVGLRTAPVQPVRKAVPVRPPEAAVPADQPDPTPTGFLMKLNPRTKRIVELCVFVCLALIAVVVCGRLIVKEADRRKEEARRRDIAAQEAKKKQQQEEAAQKALEEKQRQAKAAEEKRRQEEAAKKAEEEKRRQEEEARKAEAERKLRETREKGMAEWSSAKRQNQPDKIFISAAGCQGGQIMLFRHDTELETLIKKALPVRNRLVRYNRGVFSAVSAHEKNDLAEVDKLYQGGLKELEPNADVLSKQMADLSEKLASLAAKSDLLAGQFIIPSDGLVRGKISPGKYIAVHLSPQEDCCGHIFLKEKNLPGFLELRNGRWYDISTKKD